MKNIKGLVKIIKKDINSLEVIEETDWKENLIFDATITNTMVNWDEISAVAGSNSYLDPFNYARTVPNTYRWGCWHLWAGDRYVPNLNPTARSIGGNWWIAQEITGTPRVQNIGDGGYNTTSEVKLTQQLLPPSSGSRNIHTIGIAGNGTHYKIGKFYYPPRLNTAVSFASPISQSTTEVLVILYRILYPYDLSSDKSFNEHLFFSRQVFPPFYAEGGSIPDGWTASSSAGGSYGMRDLSSGQATWWLTKNRGQLPFDAVSTFNYDGLPIVSSNSHPTSTSPISCNPQWDGGWYFGHNIDTLDLDVGNIRGSAAPSYQSSAPGSSYTATVYNNILPVGADKTQQYYYKVSDNDTVPFFNAGEIATSDATLTLDSSNYSSQYLPEMWKIDFSGTSGGVGVVDYSFMKRYTTGYVNNTFEPRSQWLMVSSATDTFWDALQVTSSLNIAGGINTDRAREPFRALDGKDPANGLILAQHDVIVVTDFKDWYYYSNQFYPTFTATAIGQWSYDDLSDTLWASCANTGIWSIQAPFSSSATITNYDLSTVSDVAATVQNKCYAISVGTQSGGSSFRVLWALMEGALVKSVNNGSTWVGYDSTSTGGTTFTNTTIEGTWRAPWIIKADKNNADRLLILYSRSPNSSFLYVANQGGAGSVVQHLNATWWSPSNDCTELRADGNYLPLIYGGSSANFSWGAIGNANVGVNDGTSRTNYDIRVEDAHRRRWYQDMIGCTYNNSHWYLGTYDATDLDSGTYRFAPVELSWEQQIGGSPEGLIEFTNGDTYSGDTFSSLGNNNTFRDYNENFGTDTADWGWLCPFEFVDDNGNDALLRPHGWGGTGGCQKWTFTGNTCTNLGFFGMPTKPNLQPDSYATHFVGKGIWLCQDTNVNQGRFFRQAGDETTLLGVDPSWNMLGLLWDRYKWTGSAWVKRVDDNDPLTVKTTHATTDNLISGITISFDDAGATQSFSSGERILTHIVDGFINDANVNSKSGFQIASMWDNEVVTEVTNGTIASNTPSELIPITYYDTTYSGDSTNGTGFSTPSSGFVFEDTHGVTEAVPTGTWSSNFPYTSFLDSGWPSTKYPTYKVRLGSFYSGSDSRSATSNLTMTHRGKSSLSASGDFDLEVQIDQGNAGEYNNSTSNTSPYVGNLWLWHSGAHEHKLSFGLVNSALYSDASPIDTIAAESEILYGFRLTPQDDSLNGILAGQQVSTNAGGNSFNINTQNFSDYLTGVYILNDEIVIEIIESGSVVATLSSEKFHSIMKAQQNGTYSRSMARVSEDLNIPPGGFDSTASTAARWGFDDPINDRVCPFNIKRTGTTITYYIRDVLVYTSAVSSSETLVLGFITDDDHNLVSDGQYQPRYGLLFDNIMKKPQTDFWVTVGTSGSGNGSFNPDFLYLQTACREAFSIKIDGVEATVKNLEDNGTLAAGEVSVFPRQGLIRCAAADAGKTVTVAIPCAYR